ncbi:glycosyltransferase [Microbacterium oryzae]|uniref:glycosyltransferase n=1 Tax=Microbacterium oryzae TaxID=743009 RepID=UPI0025B0FFAB|nr:nucleotide disphospho-sugar-binding domain-containing protein [Microbacterium oryzae]MDN3311234.1 glycosyltransferase [Microbacterium oryzae]
MPLYRKSLMHLLLCSSPIYGHVKPLTDIARDLTRRGHRITFLTGGKYRPLAEAAGAEFVALPADADYDDADLDAWLPDRSSRRGLQAVVYDLTGMFVKPLVAQHRAVQDLRRRHRFDAIAGESAFLGLLPTLLAEPRARREPIIGVSALPMTMSSVDTAPFGPALAPGRGPLARLRNRALNRALFAGPFKPLTRALDAALHEAGAPSYDGGFFDVLTEYDVTLQLSVRELEYPRREMTEAIRFVGPLRTPPGAFDLPEWWNDLDGRTVVHVTQGTIDNADPSRLIVPTIRALAGEDVLVVASTGGAPLERVEDAYGGPLPANVRIAAFLPYAELLPRTDVVVTNGGFGGVQQALAAGVPLVVAGATEDKPEVAARVAWAGVGVNLRTGTPTPARVRHGVKAVLHGGHAAAAQEMSRRMALLPDPLEEIARTFEAAVGAPAS